VEYLELTIGPIHGIRKEELIYRLSEEGFESFIELDNSFKAYIPSSLYPAPEEEAPGLRQTEPLLKEFHVQYTWKTITEQNWNEEWEKNYDPVIINEKCFIRAPFHPSLPGMEYEIIIEPKMSFGTAHHETTALMIGLILETKCDGKRVLDMGCGTGILAILARKTGAVSVVAIDNDEWSYLNCKDNILKNNIEGIDVVLGDVNNLKDYTADIVFANINRNVLIEQIPFYSAILPAGDLFLSGFYDTDLETISKIAKENGFLLMKYLVKNSWVAAKFRK
jgi:ribosomal protein L11 methyltransferase